MARYLFWIVCVVSLIAAPRSLSATILTTGLKVHLDAAQGTNSSATWDNLVGTDAAMTSSAFTSGTTGNAFYTFNGTTSFGQIAGNPLASDADINNGFTIEVWLRPQNNTDFQAIAGFDKANQTTLNQIGLRIGDDSPVTGSIDYYAYRTSSGTFDRQLVIDESGNITLNAWTHLALTWDGTSFRGYKNGALDQTVADSVSVSGIDLFHIGAKHNSGASPVEHQFLAGDLAQVRVYDFDLSLAQVQQNFLTDALAFGVIEVPEPSAALLLAAGAACMAGMRRRRTPIRSL